MAYKGQSIEPESLNSPLYSKVSFCGIRAYHVKSLIPDSLFLFKYKRKIKMYVINIINEI